MHPLDRTFYTRDTQIVAQELLGCHLVHQVNGVKLIGKIVEVEAYLGTHDLAAHSAKGLTPRTKIMFGPAGFAYIYLIYGKYYCMNVVTEDENQGSAILIRALEPIANIDQKTTGPGLLCQAMKIDKSLNAHDLTSDNFYITGCENESPFKIVKRPRIGVSYAKHWAKRLLRFYIKGNSYVSKL